MDVKMVKIPYEQPSLKKYGTMKAFTLASSGSGGDVMGKSYMNDGSQDVNDTQKDKINSNETRGDSPPTGKIPGDKGELFNQKDPN
jgi:hypothetical protein